MSLRKQATSGMIWTFAQQFGNQAISFVVSVILARLLLPAEFGLIGMIAIFFSVGQVLVKGGLTQSLIRSKDLDDDDFSTVFYFNLAASILIYTLIYFCAPFIAEFYNQFILVDIVRLYCLNFVILAFSAVQNTKLSKRMDFKTQTMVAIPSTILGGIVGISMAYSGFGVWSLVWSALTSTFTNTVLLWWYSKWTPQWSFKIKKFRKHFGFGYKLTLSNLLNVIFKNAYLIVIGKFFSATQVGFYTRADTMKQLPVNNLTMALNKVTYPLFATIQDDDVRLKRVYKQLMQIVVYVITPVLVFLAVLAEPTFRFLFTEKWLPAVPYFQILCVAGILIPVHSYNMNVLIVKGRSDLFLKLTIIKRTLVVIAIIIAIQYGIFGLVYAQVLLSFLEFFFNAYYTNKFINYSAWEQIKDIMPIITMASIVGVVIYGLDYFFLFQFNDFIRISVNYLIAFGIYISISFFLKFNSFIDLRKIVFKK